MTDGDIAIVILLIVFTFFIAVSIAGNEESIEEKLERAIKITEEINGDYCIKYSIIDEQVISDEEYCLPLKNKKTIERFHESVLERQAELDSIKNDQILSRLANFTEPIEDKVESRRTQND